jgi:hypothetical protein
VADVRIDIASEFVGAKAFKQADTATSRLTKQVSSLAKSYIGLIGAQRLARSSFNAVKAFAEDDKAARLLGNTLKNLGLGFGENALIVNAYISSLERQTGVLDDDLRPAMDRLLRATGDVSKSQQLLSLSLDISAATGKNLAQVSQTLQRAYLGNTASLSRLGVGLTKAELASLSFEEIQNKLSLLFAGSATEAANTYSGSLAKLTVASENAKEALGRGLVDALSVLGGGGEGGLQNIINLIDKASSGLETFTRRFGVGLAQARALLSGNFSQFAAIGRAELNRGRGSSAIIPSIAAELRKAAIEKAAVKRTKEQSTILAKNTKAIKEQTALQKAGTLFDVEQTQIIAALKGKISEDERKRLELQLALITGNTTEASKLAGEIGKAQGLSQGLINFLKDLPDANNPFKGWKTYLDAIEAQVKRIAVSGTGGGGGAGSTIAGAPLMPQSITSGTTISSNDFPVAAMSGGAAVGQGGDVYVEVVIDGQKVAGAVSSYQTNNYLSGYRIDLNRDLGTFL